eukprot:CAMPEP_0168740802 /NCGR_PEP_ID=MMETSP0724-20121128/12175_1 /TAXON_ID=265536 /ORGANISM="Amphiprora sp., Strain CCMP467" /LENGTH=164 /DNA_ID=CAMNT_0008788265 /DNA_START=29 /DNA_END=523 /DNA_ORIENTATION=-
MVFGWLFGAPVPKEWPEGQPVRLPPYFPVQPKGCEQPSQQLFECVATKATTKQRELENAGFHKSYYDGSVQPPRDEKYAKYVREQQQQQQQVAGAAAPDKNDQKEEVATLPRPDENPLEQCTLDILAYQHCCNRALKKKQNWILTEPFRVQKEYRYSTTQEKQH